MSQTNATAIVWRSLSRQLTKPTGSRAQPASGRQRRARRAPVVPQAGFFDSVKDLFDYESWAPRSSQVWRLGQNPADLRRGAAEGKSSEGKLKEEDVEVLNQRLAEARDGSGAARSVGGAAAAAEAEQGEERPSFLRSTDDEVSAALAGRIAQVAANKGAAGSLSSSAVGSGEGQEGGDAAAPEGAALTGQLLADLMLAKWGKLYDLSFVRRDIPLGKTLICLNVMWTHVEQRSFPMTLEEYEEKLELVALYLNSWGQAERVAAFLREPARAKAGVRLSRPLMGTAISVQLDLDQATIDAFFSQGGV